MKPRENHSFGSPISVLLIEDNPVDLKVLEGMLSESSQYPSGSVKSATSFRAAQAALKKGGVDVVVLDLNLPDSQGVQTLSKLNEGFPDVAIVVNTGAYEDSLGLTTLGFGAQDFIVKGKYQAYGLNKAIQYAKERKKIELELISAYKNLQETQSHLIQAEKMNTVGRLASGIAHEVKNPLATILFGVAYLHERLKEGDENIALTLRNIKEASQRANEIITDLLDFASISRLNKKMEDVNAIIEKSLELTHHPISRQNVKLVKELDHKLPKTNIDRNRIEQVFVNLILNALNAMPNGGTLKLKSLTAPEKDAVCIEIEDSGDGMPEEALPHIFEPFFTTRRAQGGIGLGLSVVKNIIDMHSGKIEIANRPEGGVRAKVVLKIGGEDGHKP